jgi:hypothetical protein
MRTCREGPAELFNPKRVVTALLRAGSWWAALFFLLSVVAVVVAGSFDWFEWRRTGSSAGASDVQRSGLALLLAHLDFSVVASAGLATPADAATVRYIGWPARAVVAGVLIASLAGLCRTWVLATSAWLRALLALVLAGTTLYGLLLLMWMSLAAGFYDIEYVRIADDVPVRLTRVLPWGPFFLALAVLLQVAAWQVVRAVRRAR